MDNINLILPEIVLFLGICLILMIGVFFKNSFSIVSKLSILLLIGVIYLILSAYFFSIVLTNIWNLSSLDSLMP